MSCLVGCGGNTSPTNTSSASTSSSTSTQPTPSPTPAPVPTPGASDTVPPNVTLTAPSSAATVSGTISVTANASDNVGVVGVQFKLDSQTLGAEDTSAPYTVTWNTAYAAAGAHTLTAVARDAAGNIATSSSVIVTVSNPASSGLPSWRVGMKPWTWKTIGANTLADINPELDILINPNYPADAPWHGVMGWPSIISKWSGGAWDEVNGRLYINGTGHTDGGDNSVVAINLNVDNPVWTLLRKPTGAIGNAGVLDDGQESTGKYFDGRPRATHTYGLLNIVDGDMFLWPMGSVYKSGVGNKRAWRFSASTNDWTDLGVPLTGYEEESSGTLFVPSLRELWYFPKGNNPWWRYNVDTKAASKVSADIFSSSLKFPVYDPVRNLVIVFGNYPAGFKLVNVTDFNRDLREPVITGTPPAAYSSEGRGGDGWAYDPINDRFYSRNNTSGANLNVLLPPASGDPFTGTWTWGVLQASTENTVTPTAPTFNGTYGRFFVSAALGVVGVINDVTQKVYVMAITQGGTIAATASVPVATQSSTPFSIGTRKFATGQDASDAAVDGDTIYVEPGLYTESILLRANRLSLICPSGVAVFSASTVAYKWDKAIILINGNDNVLRGIEIYGSTPNEGGGAVVVNGSGLTINQSYFHDNAANGVLNGGIFPASDIILNDSKIERCGEGSGLTHNIYVGRIRSLVLNNTISNDPYIGHNVKSRAAKTVITGGTFIQGRGSRFLDTPVGGEVEVSGATIYRDSTLGDNKDVLGYGLEVPAPEYTVNTINFRASNKINDKNNDLTILRINPGWSPTVSNIELYTRF
ncbi:MAG: hypothetical protein HY081_02040 [Gammaproteobacteria bacterium]|nr:hypothetical protein [Gammaproteobacteria bacterium]